MLRSSLFVADQMLHQHSLGLLLVLLPWEAPQGKGEAGGISLVLLPRFLPHARPSANSRDKVNSKVTTNNFPSAGTEHPFPGKGGRGWFLAYAKARQGRNTITP